MLHTEGNPHELLLGAHNPLLSDHPALRYNKREWQIVALYALRTMEAAKRSMKDPKSEAKRREMVARYEDAPLQFVHSQLEIEQ